MRTKLPSWVPTAREIVASALGSVTLLVPGVILTIVSGVAAWMAAPQSDAGWVQWFLTAMFALGATWALIAWGAFAWRRFQSLKQRTDESSTGTIYSDDPERDAPDKQAYNDILAFAIDHVLPACEALVDLQDALVGHMCKGSKIAEIALDGLRSDGRAQTRDFWRHYDALCEGLSASPGPMLTFEGIIEHIHGLEKGSYDKFSQQMFELFCELERDKYSAMSRRVSLWREKHRSLIAAYDAIKRDTRFGKLLRPLKESRWGALKLGEPTE